MKTAKFFSLALVLAVAVGCSNCITVLADECMHSYVEEFIPPSCTSQGHYRYYCDKCMFILEDKEIPQTAHDFGQWDVVKPPSCAKKGIESRSCQSCGFVESRAIMPTQEHAFTNFRLTPATNRSDGCIKRQCRYCKANAPDEYISRIRVIELSSSSYVFDSKKHKPSVKVLNAENKKIDKKYYTVKYDKNCASIGVHKVKITFNNYYQGSFTLTYKIIPPSTNITKLKPSENKITLYYKKQNKNISGYQISYSTDKEFNKSQKMLIKNKNKSTAVINNLKKNKKYYFRVRTYKLVDNKRIYSKWSSIKSVKTGK